MTIKMTDICALCGNAFGEHAHDGGFCPTHDPSVGLYAKTSFHPRAFDATAAIEAAFREGYKEGYIDGADDAARHSWGCGNTASAAQKRKQDDAWDNSEAIKTCPHCGSTNTEKRHADAPNNAGTETDWRQCEDCDHQFDHQ